MSIAYFNGQWVEEAQACIPISDLGFQYGHGVFTTLRLCEGVPEHLNLHMQRLTKDCTALHLPQPTFSPDDIHELIVRNHAKKGIYRLKMFVTPSHRMMTIAPYTPPTKQYSLCVYPEPVVRPTAHIKSLSYLDRHWIKKYAVDRGYDEAIVVDGAGVVLETAFANLFWKVDDSIFYPDPALPILSGIALQVVLDKAKEDGQAICPVRMTLDQIPPEAELFYCNSMTGPWPALTAKR